MKLLEKLKVPSPANISKQPTTPSSELYDITLVDLQGEPIRLSDYKGKYILLVNVASECGFTPQYRDLQQLSETFKDKLVVIGAPCNQFGRQEPGSPGQIRSFCERNFGVSFLLTEKLDVKGPNQHPLYKWLTRKSLNGVKSSSVKWNFQKYLIDGQGRLLDYFYPITKPMSTRITKHFR